MGEDLKLGHYHFFRGIDKLRRADDYLRFSVGIDTPPPVAQARFEARAIIIRLQFDVLDSLEKEWRCVAESEKRNQ